MGEAAVDGRRDPGGMVSEHDPIAGNAATLERELAWLGRLIDARFADYFGSEHADAPREPGASVLDVAPPPLDGVDSAYADFVRHYRLGLIERAAVALALAGELRPQLLDIFFTRNKTFDRRFTEFGGLTTADGGFVPTGETLVYILGGADLELRLRLGALFDAGHVFAAHHILRGGADPLRAPLRISEEVLSLVTTGRPRRPAFGADFPAMRVDTSLEWDDVVLHPGTRKQIDEILAWIEHGETLLRTWAMAGRIRPGHRSLFYGPPGTGKSMTACLLGKTTGRDVYKVDLSLVVSKYIGETEKNLGRIFDQAEHREWILFFDEADALFGKRSETRDAHDRYANQEVAFLLQRIETFDGVAILASNLRDNLDPAFARRFESVIYFPMPRPEERLRLWQRGFSSLAELEPGLDLEDLARQHPLSGGTIMNVIRHASLQALRRGERLIAASDLLAGIRRELSKEVTAG
jgi:hypothetical protein